MSAKTAAKGTSKVSFTAPRKALTEALSVVGKAVATRSSLPILTNVRIDAAGEEISVMATDLQLWIKHSFQATEILGSARIVTEGAATAPARNFAELLAAMPEADVAFTVEDESNSLHLRCNKATYKLLGLSADEFPLLPQVKEESSFTVDRIVLRDAINQTIFATSTDETRAILTGILLTLQGNDLTLVATDTHRLAVRKCIVASRSGAASVIVPSRAMNEVLRILGSEENEVGIVISSNQIRFEIAHKSGAKTTLISRLIDGQFPNYERVIPTTTGAKLTVKRDGFIAAVKRASIVARESANRVVLRTSEDGERLTITAESGSIGNAHEEIEVAREGDSSPVEIAFNSKYLADVLGVLDSEGLHIEITEALRPCVVRPDDGSDYMCVLMPMQVV